MLRRKTITGPLNLYFQKAVADGAKDLPVVRLDTYEDVFSRLIADQGKDWNDKPDVAVELVAKKSLWSDSWSLYERKRYKTMEPLRVRTFMPTVKEVTRKISSGWRLNEVFDKFAAFENNPSGYVFGTGGKKEKAVLQQVIPAYDFSYWRNVKAREDAKLGILPRIY